MVIGYSHSFELNQKNTMLQAGYSNTQWSASHIFQSGSTIYGRRSTEYGMVSNKDTPVAQWFVVPGRWANGKWVSAHKVWVLADPHSVLYRAGSEGEHIARKILALELQTAKKVEKEIGTIHRDLRAIKLSFIKQLPGIT